MEMTERKLQDIVQGAIADTIRTMHSTVDMEARNGINALQQTVRSHETICVKDKAEANVQRNRMETKIDKLQAWMVKLVISTLVFVILGLFSILGFVLLHPIKFN